MKSLFILVLLTCSTLINPSGASADVSATGECFTTLDITKEAVKGDVVSGVVEVSYGTNVSYSASAIDDLEENGMFAKIEEDDCIYTLETDDCRASFSDNQRSWRYMETTSKDYSKPNDEYAYRHARDGLNYAGRVLASYN